MELVYRAVTTANTVLGVIRTVQKDASCVQMLRVALNVRLGGLDNLVDSAQSSARNVLII
jgi:hypothetical protein